MDNADVTATEPTHDRWRLGVLAALLLGSLAVMLSLAPLPQRQAYHQFADSRGWLGIANFGDVMSNLPFFLVGLLGVGACLKLKGLATRPSWLAFFVGVTIVCFGSAWYHLDPNNETLVWDRLPMTVGFMGLFIGLLAEYLDVRVQTWGLAPALLIGLGSVVLWAFTDDLRFYFWVQLAPLLAVPAVMLLFKPRYSHSWLLLVALGFYLLAKATELGDQTIFDALGGTVSGHTLKHLLAALGPLAVMRMLQLRTPRVVSEGTAASGG